MKLKAFAIALTLFATVAASARAADPKNAADDAKTLFRQGIALFDKHEYDAARDAFQRAYELAPEAKTLLNIALAELNGGHPLEALAHFKAYVAHPEAKPELIEHVKREMIPKAWKQTAHVEVTAPPGKQIAINHVTMPGRAPFKEPFDVMPGKTEISVVPSGQSVVYDLEPGETKAVGFHDAVTIAAPSPQAPPAAPVPARDAPPPSFWSTQKVLSVVLGVAGLVGVGTGVGFTLARNRARSDANFLRSQLPQNCADAPQKCSDYDAALRTANRNETLFIVAFGLGGALFVTGVVFLIFLPDDAPRAANRATVIPLIGPGHAGVGAHWTF